MGFFDSLKKEMNNMMNEQQKNFESALRSRDDEEILRAIDKCEREGIYDYRYRAFCNEASRRGL